MSAFADTFTADHFTDGRYRVSSASNRWSIAPDALSVGEVVPTPPYSYGEWLGSLSWVDPTVRFPTTPPPTEASVAVTLSRTPRKGAWVTVGFADMDADGNIRAFLGMGFNITGGPSVPAFAAQVEDDAISFDPSPSWNGLNVVLPSIPTAPVVLAMAFDAPNLLTATVTNSDAGEHRIQHTIPSDYLAAWNARSLFPYAQLFEFSNPTGAQGGEIVISEWSYAVNEYGPGENPGLIAGRAAPGGIVRAQDQGFIGAVAGAARGGF